MLLYDMRYECVYPFVIKISFVVYNPEVLNYWMNKFELGSPQLTHELSILSAHPQTSGKFHHVRLLIEDEFLSLYWFLSFIHAIIFKSLMRIAEIGST